MPYSPTSWVSGTTPVDAPEMNNIESGISNCLYKDGAVANTGTQDFNRTLSGADKTFLTFTATDGKQYSILERTSDHALVVHNVTDNVDLLVLGPAATTRQIGGGTAVIVDSSGSGAATTPRISVGPNAPSSPSKFDVWIKTPFS